MAKGGKGGEIKGRDIRWIFAHCNILQLLFQNFEKILWESDGLCTISDIPKQVTDGEYRSGDSTRDSGGIIALETRVVVGRG